ncbi:MAG TPA: carbonic anhydrase family protein [Thermodesulfovibrionales bacterium]|nr:carbonic anhydrase family protein [Thermodesulfovibrionales bacterium]
MGKRILCTAVIFLLVGFIFGCKPAEKPAEKPTQEVKHEIHWAYQGEGAPVNWGKLKPEFALCGTGMSQSPIDLSKTYKTKPDAIRFAYKETPLKIVNNGHAVQVNYEPGSSVMIDGQKYELLQFHFHASSEHTVKGAFYDMEMHLVHKSDKDDLAVVGVFLKKGNPNKIIQALWDNLPTEINQENVVDGLSVNASGFLPKDTKYYHYYGSLTTPPCTEGVNWSVLTTPIEVSEEQIQKFKTLMGFDNNRPVLPLNKRFVLESQ